jgi:hypothetical protein
MSKTSELDMAITELLRCGETLIRVADALRGMFSSDVTEREQARPEVRAFSLEDVRALLLAKNRAGFREEVKALLLKHGAERLTDVESSEYASLMAEAEVLGNG